MAVRSEIEGDNLESSILDSTPVSDASVEIESPSMFDEPQSEKVEIEDTVSGSEPIKTPVESRRFQV